MARKRPAKPFRPRLKPVPQPRKARARTIPNSLFARTLDIPDALATAMLRDMYRIRHAESALAALAAEGRLAEPHYPYSGLEAVAVGVASVLGAGDTLLSTHRPLGHLLARGVPLKGLFAEALRLPAGLCGGRAGLSGLVLPEFGILGTAGAPGETVPLALGAALAQQLDGKKGVTVCFFGEGAAQFGATHEALSLAAQWSLPLLFVFEHDTPGGRPRSGFRAAHLWQRAQSYGLHAAALDGMRVTDVREAAAAALERARAGEGPTLLECHVHRLPEPAADAAAQEQWKAIDPLTQFRIVLAETDVLPPKQADAVEADVLAEVKASAAQAARPAPEADGSAPPRALYPGWTPGPLGWTRS